MFYRFFSIFPHSLFCWPVLPFQIESVSRPNFFVGISLVCHISVESAVHVIQETEGTHRLSALQRLLNAAGTFASSAEENLMQGKLPMVPFSALVSEGWQDEMRWNVGEILEIAMFFHRKTSRTESIRSVAWNTPPRCIRPFVQRWNGGPLALSVPKAGCPCHGRRALQLSAWCLVASKGTMQDGTFTRGFPYHADSHLMQSWESGVSPVNGV